MGSDRTPRINSKERAMSHYNVTVHGVTYLVNLLKKDGEEISFSIDGQTYDVRVTRPVSEPRPLKSTHFPIPHSSSHTGPVSPIPSAATAQGDVTAPIPGILSSIKVSIGDQVSAGDTVAIIEAMKMENPIRAHSNGKVTHIYGKAGDEVKVGTPLVKIEIT